jgi:hypothetical protein
VATPDQRPYAAGVGEGVALVVAAIGASVLEGVAVAVAACVGAATGLEAAGAHPPRSRPTASSSHTALGVTSCSTLPGAIPLQALGGEVLPDDRLAERDVAHRILGGRARLAVLRDTCVELQRLAFERRLERRTGCAASPVGAVETTAGAAVTEPDGDWVGAVA